MADVDIIEAIETLGVTPSPRVLGLYVEGSPRARELTEAAGRAARAKPVLALKVGRAPGEPALQSRIRAPSREPTHSTTAPFGSWAFCGSRAPESSPMPCAPSIHSPSPAATVHSS